jgi:ribosome biogenesis GTPase
LKKDKLYHRDFIAIGDVVEFELNQDRTGIINTVDERINHLSRKLPKVRGASYRGERLEQVIAANIDNVCIVSSVSEPKFNNRVIDRFLVSAESSYLNSLIIINKMDLEKPDSMQHWVDLYNLIGYNVLQTSVINSEGIDELKNQLIKKKNLFWGQSGVGKSSLLNKLFPQLNLKVGDISKFSSKGTHTTVTSYMISIDEETFIIDTPGIREIDPYGIRKEDLGHYFKEFNQYNNNCKFNTCTHHHEPGCAVIKAVESGMISEYRYESYLRILDTIEDDINF